MAFCQYCGTNLEGGVVCNCEGATQANAAPAAPTAPASEAPAAPTAPTAATPASAAPSNPSQVSETAKATMNEVTGTLKAFAKDPMAVTASTKDVSSIASLTLLALQSLLCVLMIWFPTADLRESLVDYAKRVKDFNYSDPGTFIWLFVIFLLNSGVIFGLLYIFTKLFKSNDDYKKILSTVSLASIPWSMLWVLMIVVNFVVAEPTKGLIVFILAITIFIMVASICLLFSGLTKSIENGYKRMLSVALTYGIGVPLYFYIAGKFLEKSPLLESLIDLMGGFPL